MKTEKRSLSELLRLGPYARSGHETRQTMEEAANLLDQRETALLEAAWACKRIVVANAGTARAAGAQKCVEAILALKEAKS